VRLLVAAIAALLAAGTACDDLVLDGPPRTEPGRCGPGLELDPDLGRCVPARCRDDDGCPPDRRCDLILGECVPCEEGACFSG